MVEPQSGGNELFPSTAWHLLLPGDPAGSSPAAATASMAANRAASAESGASDLVVADELSQRAISQAFTDLRPGGVAYLQGPWNRGRPNAWLSRRLRIAGFRTVTVYSLSPAPDRWQESWWIPVGHRQAARFLANRRRPTGRRAVGLRAATTWLGATVMARLAATLVPAVARQPWVLHPRRGQQLCVVAVKPGGPSNPSSVPALALSALVGRSSSDAAVAMRVGGSSTDQPILLVFAGGSAEPSIIIKAPDRAEEQAAAAREREVLLALSSDETSSIVPGIPRAVEVGSGRRGEATGVFGQTAIPGRPLSQVVTPANFAPLADRVTDWLLEFSARTAGPAPADAYRDIVSSTVSALADEPWAGSLGGALAGFSPRSQTRFHRDFGPWNVHLDPDRGVGVIDWVDSVARGPLGCDLVHFLTHLAFCSVDGYGPDRRDRLIAELVDGRSPVADHSNRCLDRYLTELGEQSLDRRQVKLLSWAMAAARRPPERRTNSIYTELVAAKLGVDQTTAATTSLRRCPA